MAPSFGGWGNEHIDGIHHLPQTPLTRMDNGSDTANLRLRDGKNMPLYKSFCLVGIKFYFVEKIKIQSRKPDLKA